MKFRSAFGPSLSHRILSPNGDNDLDFVEIIFHLPKSGFNSKIEIFNLTGMKLKKFPTQILAMDDFIIWNGDSDWGSRIPPGNYIIQVELIHPDGDILNDTLRLVVDY